MRCLDCLHLTDRAPNPLGRGECKHKPDAWGIDKACSRFTNGERKEYHEDEKIG